MPRIRGSVGSGAERQLLRPAGDAAVADHGAAQAGEAECLELCLRGPLLAAGEERAQAVADPLLAPARDARRARAAQALGPVVGAAVAEDLGGRGERGRRAGTRRSSARRSGSLARRAARLRSGAGCGGPAARRRRLPWWVAGSKGLTAVRGTPRRGRSGGPLPRGRARARSPAGSRPGATKTPSRARSMIPRRSPTLRPGQAASRSGGSGEASVAVRAIARAMAAPSMSPCRLARPAAKFSGVSAVSAPEESR